MRHWAGNNGHGKQRKRWAKARQKRPPVTWDPHSGTFSIALKGMQGVDAQRGVEVEWRPEVTYVVRLREAGSREWSFGFVGLEPDTRYEVEVRPKNERGEGRPMRFKTRTSASGALGV